MLETHHQTRRRLRRALVLISVSALMAFALFPTVAGAESSSGIQYRDVPPTATGNVSDDPPATSSGSDSKSGQSSTDPGTSTDEDKGDGSKDDAGAGGKGDGQGGAGKGSDRERESTRVNSGAPLEAAPTSSDSGSSPLVPILIALAVLAAISIGVVAWRRRQAGGEDPGAGSPVSPEAS